MIAFRKPPPFSQHRLYLCPDGSLLGETANGGSTLATEYVWLPSAGNGPPQLLGVIRNTTLYYVHDDHLGRPQVVTTASGSIVWQAANAAFDRTVTTDTFGGLNLGFPGQYYDAESGLYYNGFRYYDPTSGRYLQPDPLGLIGGANPFVYALNDPLRLIDPAGLSITVLPPVHVTATRLIDPFFAENFLQLGSQGLAGNEPGGGGGGAGQAGQQGQQRKSKTSCTTAAQDFANNFRDDLRETNSFFFQFPTSLARSAIGATLGSAGLVTRTIGGVTPLEAFSSLPSGGIAIFGGPGGTLLAGIYGYGANTLVVAGSLESGIVIGSGVAATGETLLYHHKCQ